MTSSNDLRWLQQALRWAHRCPPSDTAYSVGAVVVDADDRELANGYSREGDPHQHAEESALAKVEDSGLLRTATLYSTLEPCSMRRSKSLSCSQLIIDAGLRRVVMAWREPTRFVTEPRGYETLVACGIEVIEMPELGDPYY